MNYDTSYQYDIYIYISDISDIKLLSYRENIIINQIISISEIGMRLERYHIRIMCYMWCTCYAIYIYNWCDINDVITVMILYDMIVMTAVMIWYDSNDMIYDTIEKIQYMRGDRISSWKINPYCLFRTVKSSCPFNKYIRIIVMFS